MLIQYVKSSLACYIEYFTLFIKLKLLQNLHRYNKILFQKLKNYNFFILNKSSF